MQGHSVPPCGCCSTQIPALHVLGWCDVQFAREIKEILCNNLPAIPAQLSLGERGNVQRYIKNKFFACILTFLCASAANPDLVARLLAIFVVICLFITRNARETRKITKV